MFLRICLVITLTFISITLNAQIEASRTYINKNLFVEPIGRNCLVFTSFIESDGGNLLPYNGMVYMNNNAALLVDTPPNDTLTLQLIRWLEENRKCKLEAVVYTHLQNKIRDALDFCLQEDIPTYAPNSSIIEAKRKKIPLPEKGFQKVLKLKIGQHWVFVQYTALGQSTDNSVVWLPREKVLFGGVLVHSLDSRSLGDISEVNSGPWSIALDNLLQTFPSAQWVIPGKGGAGSIELIQHTKQLMLE